jgi:hypothetical protein
MWIKMIEGDVSTYPPHEKKVFGMNQAGEIFIGFFKKQFFIGDYGQKVPYLNTKMPKDKVKILSRSFQKKIDEMTLEERNFIESFVMTHWMPFETLGLKEIKTEKETV